MVYLPRYVPNIPTANFFLDGDGYLIDYLESRVEKRGVQCTVKAKLLLNLLKQLIHNHLNIRVAIDDNGAYLVLYEDTTAEVPLGVSFHGESGMILFHSVLLVFLN